MKILLIAGHGAGDPGAIATHGGKTYYERDLARQVVQYVASFLKDYAEVTVYPTGQNAYYDYQNGTLKQKAGFAGYDYVLEVHFNASSFDAGDGKIKGCEAYVTTSESGISVEEQILFRLSALGYTNRGVKRHNWAVISTAKGQGTSSCLLETCFIDDGDDMKLYLAAPQKTAEAIARGIIDGFGLVKQEISFASPLETALEILHQKKVISSPEYWQQHAGDIPYLEELLIKVAAALK